MSLLEMINSSSVIFDEQVTTKEQLFNVLADKMLANGDITNRKKFLKDLYKREEQVATGIEDGFGIPHAKSKAIRKPVIYFAHTAPIQDYLGIDGSPVECVFALGIPYKANDTHLDILSKLARKLMNDDFKERLKEAKNADEIINLLKSEGDFQ